MIGNIQFLDQRNNKTKNTTRNGYHLMHRAKKLVVGSKGRYKNNKINSFSVVLESKMKKHVINTYLKKQIPMMSRKFFKNFAENEDYVDIYRNNPYKKFNRFFVDWYMCNVIKSNTDA